jgi:hypothetical protein
MKFQSYTIKTAQDSCVLMTIKTRGRNVDIAFRRFSDVTDCADDAGSAGQSGHRNRARPRLEMTHFPKWSAGSASTFGSLRGGTPHPLLGKKAKLELGKAVADLFHCARLEAKPLGHHRQTATQFPIAFLDVVSDFAAFKCCQQGIGNPAPGHRLPLLQLVDLAA